MENFVFDTYASGKDFIGRRNECQALSNMLDYRENVVIYEPPKSGKLSLIRKVLSNKHMNEKKLFDVAEVDLFNVRKIEDFLMKFAAAVIRPIMTTADEYRAAIEKYLPDTHFVFDRERFAAFDEVLSLSWSYDEADIVALLSMPGLIAADRRQPYYVVINNFQNLLEDSDYETVLHAMEKVFASMDKSEPNGASFILSGSKVNAMKYIFEEKKYFFRQVEHLPLEPVDSRDYVEYIVKTFQPTGKVIERDVIISSCALFKGNMWYINHYMYLADTLSRGYINEGLLMQALHMIVSVNEPRFVRMTDDLTGFQLNMVKAILDGVKKFSSVDIIEKYGLNSSANVLRLKEALKKKEIISFDDNGEAYFLDPLFEYWLAEVYFK